MRGVMSRVLGAAQGTAACRGACIERDSRLGLQSAPPFAPALSDPPIPLFVIGSHTLGEPPASEIVHRHSLSASHPPYFIVHWLARPKFRPEQKNLEMKKRVPSIADHPS